jgi:hypothetical protein
LLKEMSEDFPEKLGKIETALYEYLYAFEMGPHLIYDNELHKVKWDNSSDIDDAKRCIVKLGILLQHLRCIATTWHTEGTEESEYAYSVSQPEDPRRAITLLRNLARGHALLTGRNYITMEDIPLVVKTVLSTAQIERVSVFYLLVDNDGDASTDEIIDYLHVSRPTALRTMAELRAIRLVERYEAFDDKKNNHIMHIRLKDGFNWFLSSEFKKLREGFVPVDNSEFIDYRAANKEKCTPYTPQKSDLSPEQIDTLWLIVKAMEEEQSALPTQVDKDTISGEILRQRLVETGKFRQSEAVKIVEGMDRFGSIEKVSYDTYRRKIEKK